VAHLALAHEVGDAPDDSSIGRVLVDPVELEQVDRVSLSCFRLASQIVRMALAGRRGT
jgi:hypothetical protein